LFYSESKRKSAHQEEPEEINSSKKLKTEVNKNIKTKPLSLKFKLFLCTKCGKTYKSKCYRDKHTKNCKLYCNKCNQKFKSKQKAEQHKCKIKSHKYKCRDCNLIFNNRKELYNHKMQQHGQGDVNLEFPFEEQPPWENDNGELVNEKLKNIYFTNAEHILKNNETKSTVNLYNFPTNNLKQGSQELETHLRKVYENEKSAFKVNLSLGFILKNKETGEYRYYIPYKNNELFNQPMLIKGPKTFQKVIDSIKKIDPYSYIMNSRPNSKFEPVFVSNINFTTYKTNFRIGHPPQLPEFIEKKKYLKTFIRNASNSKLINDNLCFFRCLAFHNNANSQKLEKQTKKLFNQWNTYANLETTPQEYGGVLLSDLNDLEKCFKVNINVYELTPSNTLLRMHYSLSKFPNTINLNCFDNHFMYITDLNLLAPRFQCKN
jgi:hypothetical protein